MKRILLILSIILVLVGGFLLFYKKPGTSAIKNAHLTVGNASVDVEVADTAASRELGLSGRGGLEEGKGMFFVFPTPDKYGFWMKDMKFSIDIIWLSEAKVVSIQKSATPASFPEIFYPAEPVSYVLEVPAGYSDRHNLKVGDSFFVGS